MRNYIGNNNEINKKKYKKSLPPKLNPDAGNVEHNIDMFNKASSGDANLSSAAGMNGMAESYDRDSLIARITEFGKHYNFDKYTDAQLNAMLNRLVDASNHKKKVLPKHQDRIDIKSERHIMNDDPSYNFDDPDREGEYRVENLREALNKLDHYCIDNDKIFYDLRSLYENIQHQLTPQEKQELKKLVDTTNDPDAIKAYIDSKDPQKKNEELDEGVLDDLRAKKDAKRRAEDPLYDKMRQWQDQKEHPKKYRLKDFVYDQKFLYADRDKKAQTIKNVESVIFDLESIPSGAFMNCPNLKSISFKRNPIIIGSKAFMNCTGLTDVDLPETVHTIEDEAFKGCSNLQHLVIPNKKVRIGQNVFEGCTKLQKNKNESLKLKNKYNEAINSNYRVDTWIDNKDKITPSKLKKEISSYPEGTYLRLCRKGAINAMNQYTYGFVKVEPDQWVAYSSIVGLSNNTPLTDQGILQLVDKYNIKNLGVKISQSSSDNSMVAADWSDETDVDFDESLKLKEDQKKTAEQFAEKAIDKIKKILIKKYSINPESEFSYSIEGIGDINDWVQDEIPASGLIAKIKFDQKIDLYNMNYDILLDFDCDKIYKLLENKGFDVIDVSPDRDDIIVIEIAVPLEYQNRGVSLADWNDETDVDFDESLNEDTVKQGNKWVNKGKEGTHGKFKTKKAADAQRKAMFANGYKGESLEESRSPLSKMNINQLRDIAVSLGADRKQLFGTSKQAMILIIHKLEKNKQKENSMISADWDEYTDIDFNESLKRSRLNEKISGDVTYLIGIYGDEIPGFKSLDSFLDHLESKGLTIVDSDGDMDYGWDITVSGPGKILYNTINNKVPGYNCSTLEDFIEQYSLGDFDDTVEVDWDDTTDVDFDESLKLKESSPVNYKKKISLIREIDKGIPYSMRYKEADIVNDYDNDELILYWVTEDPFTKGELQEFAFYATECCHDIYDDIMQIALTYRGISRGVNFDYSGDRLIWIDAAGEWTDEDWDNYVEKLKKVGVDVQVNDLIAADWEDSTDFDFDESLKLKKKRR